MECLFVNGCDFYLETCVTQGPVFDITTTDLEQLVIHRVSQPGDNVSEWGIAVVCQAND